MNVSLLCIFHVFVGGFGVQPVTCLSSLWKQDGDAAEGAAHKMGFVRNQGSAGT